MRYQLLRDLFPQFQRYLNREEFIGISTSIVLDRFEASWADYQGRDIDLWFLNMLNRPSIVVTSNQSLHGSLERHNRILEALT